MIKLYRHTKNIKFFSYTFALLFALLNLSTATPIHAAPNIVPPILSPNWSGFVATAPLGTFTKVECNLKVPTVSSSGVVSSWCGLGGIPDIVDPQNPIRGEKEAILVQAGIDACMNSRYCLGNCRRNVQCDAAWWEIADALPVQPVRFSKGIKPGDTIHVYMQSNLRNDHTDTFLIENETPPRQETHIITVNKQGATIDNQPTQIITAGTQKFSIPTDGASVDYIVERSTDTLNFSLIPLGDFQSATITGCHDARINHPGLESISSLPTLTPMDLINDNGGGNAFSNNSSQQSNASSQANIIAKPTNFFGRFRDSFTVIQQSSTGQPTGNSTARIIGQLPR